MACDYHDHKSKGHFSSLFSHVYTVVLEKIVLWWLQMSGTRVNKTNRSWSLPHWLASSKSSGGGG